MSSNHHLFSTHQCTMGQSQFSRSLHVSPRLLIFILLSITKSKASFRILILFLNIENESTSFRLSSILYWNYVADHLSKKALRNIIIIIIPTTTTTVLFAYREVRNTYIHKGARLCARWVTCIDHHHIRYVHTFSLFRSS
jgi:hypothetical protein